MNMTHYYFHDGPACFGVLEATEQRAWIRLAARLKARGEFPNWRGSFTNLVRLTKRIYIVRTAQKTTI